MNIPQNLPAPSPFLFFAEPRFLLESLSVLLASEQFKNMPEGNDDPVMVLPGLTTSDEVTFLLRRFLIEKGYRVYGWGLGINRGYIPKYEDKLLRKIRYLYLKHGKKLRLVGWSMGGIYARELAKISPDVVGQVITMGSPFSGGKNQKTNVSTVYRLLNGQKISEVHDRRALELHLPAPVPTSAIYSKTDGVVHWKYCMEYAEGDHLENIEVKGSHLGMGFNSMIYTVLADRLSQDLNNWKPFDEKILENIPKMGLL